MKSPKMVWHALGSSVRGASHERTGLCNQDALSCSIDKRSRKRVPGIVVVSDGHGSPDYFRSHRGSTIAVKQTTKILKEFHLLIKQKKLGLSEINDLGKNVVRKQITQQWLEQVKLDIEEKPFTKLEKEKLGTDYDFKKEISSYGATLLGVLISEEYMTYFQLGDGDILSVSNQGDVKRIFKPDEELISNETYSLCDIEAWRKCKFHGESLEHSHPALTLVSTDGYSNSFASEKAFLQVGSDILTTIKKKGLGFLETHLEHWLKLASMEGSGDDVTLGILSSIDRVEESSSLIGA